MATITICSDFGAQKNEVWHCFHCFSISHELMGPDDVILVFWMLSSEELMVLNCGVGEDSWGSLDCSTPGFPVSHYLPEFAQIHVHWVSDAIQPSHPLSSPSPPALNLSQHQGLFKWVSSLHQVAKVLEFQLQHQSFPWTFRTDSFRMN